MSEVKNLCNAAPRLTAITQILQRKKHRFRATPMKTLFVAQRRIPGRFQFASTKFTVICVSTSIASSLRMYGLYRHWLTA